MHQTTTQEKLRAHQRVFVPKCSPQVVVHKEVVASKRRGSWLICTMSAFHSLFKLSGQSRGGLQPKTVSPDWFVKGTALQASLGMTWSAVSVQAAPSICNKSTGSIAGQLCSTLPWNTSQNAVMIFWNLLK